MSRDIQHMSITQVEIQTLETNQTSKANEWKNLEKYTEENGKQWVMTRFDTAGTIRRDFTTEDCYGEKSTQSLPLTQFKVWVSHSCSLAASEAVVVELFIDGEKASSRQVPSHTSHTFHSFSGQKSGSFYFTIPQCQTGASRHAPKNEDLGTIRVYFRKVTILRTESKKVVHEPESSSSMPTNAACAQFGGKGKNLDSVVVCLEEKKSNPSSESSTVSTIFWEEVKVLATHVLYHGTKEKLQAMGLLPEEDSDALMDPNHFRPERVEKQLKVAFASFCISPAMRKTLVDLKHCYMLLPAEVRRPEVASLVHTSDNPPMSFGIFCDGIQNVTWDEDTWFKALTKVEHKTGLVSCEVHGEENESLVRAIAHQIFGTADLHTFIAAFAAEQNVGSELEVLKCLVKELQVNYVIWPLMVKDGVLHPPVFLTTKETSCLADMKCYHITLRRSANMSWIARSLITPERKKQETEHKKNKRKRKRH